MTPQQRTALLSVVAAALLVALKLVTGLLTSSLGLISEALHSATDLVAALLTYFAVKVAMRPPDPDHPYGHGKAEHLAALAEAAFLVSVSAFIAWRSIERLAGRTTTEVNPTWYAIAVVLVVIAIDASRAVVSWRASRRYRSSALASNALHFSADLVGSTAVLIGLLLARAGHPGADAVAALIVGVLVILAAVRLMRENINVLMDRAPAAAAARAREAIRDAEPGVDLRRLRTREAGGKYFVDAVVGIKADAAIGQGHAVADSVEEAVHRALPESDVVVHVEPASDATAGLRERASGAALTVRGVREVHNVSITSVDGNEVLSLHLKLPADMDLEAAHAVATEVETAIRRAVPEIGEVHTHIEPLAEAGQARRPVGAEAAAAHDAIRQAVREVTGADPKAVRLIRDGRGVVALVTIRLAGDEPLGEAHTKAAEVERRARQRAPGVVEVIVHTEPG